MTDATDTVERGEQPTLKRAIGPKLLLLFVVGDILGTGIYALTGSVAAEIGGALWLPFLLAFLVAFLTAFSYLELVGKYPRAAGAALYTHKAFGINFLTFMVTFTVMASGVTSAATAAKAFGDTYLREFVELPTWGVATAFILGLALINFRGVGESVKANVGLTLVELSGLLLIIGAGIYAVVGRGEGDAARLTQIDTGDSTAFLAITAATSLAFFAMVGFEDSVNMAEECRDPVRIFPRAMLLGMGIAAAIYVAVAVLSSMLVPAEVLGEAKSGALFRVLEAGAPGFPLAVFAAIGLLAVINSALINMLMASRLLYGMANERILPRVLGTVHPARRTPWVSIAFTSVIAIILVGTADISLLGGTTALLLLAVFTIVNIAVLVLRRDPVDHQHFRAPKWTPWVGIVTCGFLATPLSGRPVQQFLVAGVLLAVGAVLWLVNRWYVGSVEVDARKLGKG
ncbi:APC family permease [Pseudonocardia sp.]|uniref:APC family permease n=1 Tax=Pseudonocardia sp. TaxID=60912 RepID=UPI003D0D609B